jgi:hypothetical protein
MQLLFTIIASLQGLISFDQSLSIAQFKIYSYLAVQYSEPFILKKKKKRERRRTSEQVRIGTSEI